MPVGISPKIEKLLKWSKRPMVDRMLDTGDSPDKVCRWVNGQGFKISSPTMYSYRDKRKEALVKGITVEELLREQYERLVKGMDFKGDRGLFRNTKVKLKNSVELLDEVIQKGMDWLQENTKSYLTVNYALRAIEIKERITGGKLGGMTFAGLDEYKRITEGRMQAIIAVAIAYIPEELQPQVLKEMFEAEKAFMEENGLLEEFEADEDTLNQLNEMDKDMDKDIDDSVKKAN